MSRIVVTEFMTLDGVVEFPHHWSFPYWNDQIGAYKTDELAASDALLLGRVTWEEFAQAWPGRKDDTGFADRFNSMPKYVVSRTLKDAGAWNNSHILGPDLPAEVGKLRKAPGRDIVVHGSPSLVRGLLGHDLVDEYRLLVYPLVRGKGKRLFDGSVDAKLELTAEQRFDTGVVALTYAPARRED